MVGSLTSAPVAELRTIDYEELRNGSINEAAKLFEAAKDDGVFYINLTGDNTAELAEHVENIYELSRALFGLNSKVKMQFDVDKLGSLKLNGYKPIGRNIGGIQGQRDGFESYAISRNNILSLTSAPFPRPLPVEEYLPNLEQLTLGCMDISQTIFRILSEALSLPSGGAFESFHRHSHPSPDVIRLLKYAAHQSDAPCVPQTAHTDLGSLTFLFTRSPGLQVQREVGEEWMYVLPKEGHAVVNLGDAMTLFTDGLFRSCLHRVASMPGQAMQESPLIQPHVSPREPITCRDWIARKFVILRSKADNANESRILTGRS